MIIIMSAEDWLRIGIAIVVIGAAIGIVVIFGMVVGPYVAGATIIALGGLWLRRNYRSNVAALDKLERGFGTRDGKLIDRYLATGVSSSAHFVRGDDTTFDFEADTSTFGALHLDHWKRVGGFVAQAADLVEQRRCISPRMLMTELNLSSDDARALIWRMFDESIVS